MSYEIRPLHTYTGSEVVGLDLSKALDRETRDRLDRELAERGVLVFRDQHLGPPDFIRAIENFGELMEQQVKKFSLPDHPIVGYISSRDLADPQPAAGSKASVRGENYHTDHSNFLAPPKATALCAVDLPASGGDTQFVNVQAAYADLPAEMREKLDALRSRHVFQSSRSPRKFVALSDEERKAIPETEQPLVVSHPLTGRKGLYLNTGRMEGIVGLPDAEAASLIDGLMSHATSEKYEYRHRWRPGDVVIWDNRTVMHKANADVPPDQYRYLYRLMVKGQPLT